ncbi:hypothetical protein DFH06DRAFT_1316580 [Mycena polygramma]|nr:hypothetical protein DFH06DRAFT_1316580 [Mycena polygramma]
MSLSDEISFLGLSLPTLRSGFTSKLQPYDNAQGVWFGITINLKLGNLVDDIMIPPPGPLASSDFALIHGGIGNCILRSARKAHVRFLHSIDRRRYCSLSARMRDSHEVLSIKGQGKRLRPPYDLTISMSSSQPSNNVGGQYQTGAIGNSRPPPRACLFCVAHNQVADGDATAFVPAAPTAWCGVTHAHISLRTPDIPLVIRAWIR